MFVGVVVENFHKCRESQEQLEAQRSKVLGVRPAWGLQWGKVCRESQEQEEKARRAAQHARKLERRRKRKIIPYTLLNILLSVQGFA